VKQYEKDRTAPASSAQRDHHPAIRSRKRAGSWLARFKLSSVQIVWGLL